jgi:putative transposase
MRASRFSEEQIIGILREHEAGAKTPELCRRHGISDATFYKWKAKYGGLEVSEARRLKSLEDENRRLKKLWAEAMLDNAALKDILGKTADACGATLNGWPADGRPRTKPTARLQAGGYRPFDAVLSARRANDDVVRKRLRELAAQRRRFGYRRLGWLLARGACDESQEALLALPRGAADGTAARRA